MTPNPKFSFNIQSYWERGKKRRKSYRRKMSQRYINNIKVKGEERGRGRGIRWDGERERGKGIKKGDKLIEKLSVRRYFQHKLRDTLSNPLILLTQGHTHKYGNTAHGDILHLWLVCSHTFFTFQPITQGYTQIRVQCCHVCLSSELLIAR